MKTASHNPLLTCIITIELIIFNTVRVWGKIVPAPLKESGQGPFSVEQGIIRETIKENIQGHKPVNDKEGSDGN